jgi:hypothetical protein
VGVITPGIDWELSTAMAVRSKLGMLGTVTSVNVREKVRSPGCKGPSDTTLYVSLVIIHKTYTGWRQNDFSVYA